MKITTLLSTTALIASLALSQAALAAPDKAAAPGSTPVSAAQGSLLDQLPADKAKLYKEAMGRLQQKNTSLRDQVVKLQHDLSTIMTAPKFDKGAYAAKNGEIQKVVSQMRNNWIEETSGLATKFSLDERKTLDNLLQQRPQPHPAAPAAK